MFKKMFTPNESLTKGQMFALGLIQAVVIILLWQFSGFSLLPKPTEILASLEKLWAIDELAYNLISTLKWNFGALFFSTVVALVLSYSTVIPFMRPLVNIISKIRFMGIAGWLFLFVVISPNETVTKLLLFMFGYCGYIISSVVSIVNTTKSDELNYARTLRMNEWHASYTMIVRGKLDQVFDTVRDTAAMGLLILVMIETFFRSQGGLGVLIQNKSKVLDLSAIFALQLVVFFVGIFQDWAILQAKKLICPHAFIKLERR